MKGICVIGFIAAFLYGLLVLFASQSAIHEIEAFVLFLIGAVLFGAAGIIDALDDLKNKK